MLFFWGMGFQEADFEKAQVGIGVPLLEGNLCNVHAYSLAKHIQSGCQDAGLIAFPFGVPAVSDNLVQGGETWRRIARLSQSNRQCSRHGVQRTSI